MLAKRIIPCLDVKNGQVVKGINFEGLREVGDPVEMGAFYSEQGADELVYLDISASSEGRRTFTDLVSRIAERIDIPFTVGGGISSFEDAARLLDAGADKITINTAAVFHPEIISKIASRYGSQFVVVAIDARMVASGTAAEPVEATSLYGNAYWQVMTHGGKRPTDKELYSWAKQVQNLGAGEILLTSMDADGTKDGYDIELTRAVSDAVNVPVIASGGAGKLEHFYDVLTLGHADAVLAASVFHYGQFTVRQVKEYLKSRGVEVRF